MEKYVGKIGIVGRPNAGKSSLLNALLKEKVSIVNKKPQATRNNLARVFNTDKYYLQFIDTPGFHTPINKLDEFLNKEVKQIFKDINLIYFLVDVTRPLNDEDRELLKLIHKHNISTILVYTKTDLQPFIDLNVFLSELTKIHDFVDVAQISINSEETLNNLLEKSEQFLNYTNANFTYRSEFILDDDKFLVSEIIREKCMDMLDYEIPYGIAVVVEAFNYNPVKKIINIDASIIVEKESHKKIIIGRNGNKIKEISIASRLSLLEIYDAKICLKVFVKVNKNWRNNLTKLKEFGYVA